MTVTKTGENLQQALPPCSMAWKEALSTWKTTLLLSKGEDDYLHQKVIA